MQEWGLGVYGNFYTFLQFFHEPKTVCEGKREKEWTVYILNALQLTGGQEPVNRSANSSKCEVWSGTNMLIPLLLFPYFVFICDRCL